MINVLTIIPKLGALFVLLDKGDNADSFGDDFVNPPILGVIKVEAVDVFLLDAANNHILGLELNI